MPRTAAGSRPQQWMFGGRRVMCVTTFFVWREGSYGRCVRTIPRDLMARCIRSAGVRVKRRMRSAILRRRTYRVSGIIQNLHFLLFCCRAQDAASHYLLILVLSGFRRCKKSGRAGRSRVKMHGSGVRCVARCLNPGRAAVGEQMGGQYGRQRQMRTARSHDFSYVPGNRRSFPRIKESFAV
ncbi:hypothetical protein F5Y15DRAFT_77632 [Xylariaceae sp. FL0016]|nr:hypothetical protein F5Y15DRAFT_77632 [Xylariaceae sp. FL0016]